MRLNICYYVLLCFGYPLDTCGGLSGFPSDSVELVILVIKVSAK